MTLELKVQCVVSYVLALGSFFAGMAYWVLFYHCWLLNSPLYKREGNWDQLTFAKTSGTVTREGKTIDLASLVTIPETIAGHVSAPVPFSFLNANVAIFLTALCLPRFLCIFSRHATGFLRTTRQTNLYRTGSDQPCNSLNDKRLGMGWIRGLNLPRLPYQNVKHSVLGSI